MNWNNYEIFNPGVDAPLHTLPRKEARRHYDHMMASIPERVEALRSLAATHGVDLGAPGGLEELNQWFLRSVEPDPERPDRLLPVWYSMVNDIALYLSSRLIEESSSLRWELLTDSKKDLSYQRPVVRGFGKVANKNYYADLDLAFAMYGHRIVTGQKVDSHLFRKAYEQSLAKA